MSEQRFIVCPECGAKYDFDESYLGHNLECAECQKKFLVDDNVTGGDQPSPAPVAKQVVEPPKVAEGGGGDVRKVPGGTPSAAPSSSGGNGCFGKMVLLLILFFILHLLFLGVIGGALYFLGYIGGGKDKAGNGVVPAAAGKAAMAESGKRESPAEKVGRGLFSARKSAPKGALVIKGLYVSQPGDDALEACKALVASSKDLAVVDFRKGIEREKDEAAKAAEKEEYEKNVKLAEKDVERFLSWHDTVCHFYDPSASSCEGESNEEREPYLTWGDQESAKIPGPNHTSVSAMMSLAAICGYQAEWMLVGKSSQEKPKVGVPTEMLTGRFSIHADKNGNNGDVGEYWVKHVKTGALRDLYAKGLKIFKKKENDDKARFRLVLQDAEGNPVEKRKLAVELVLAMPDWFKGTNTEKLNQADHELEAFLKWGEYDLYRKELIRVIAPLETGNAAGTGEEKRQQALKEKLEAMAKLDVTIKNVFATCEKCRVEGERLMAAARKSRSALQQYNAVRKMQLAANQKLEMLRKDKAALQKQIAALQNGTGEMMGGKRDKGGDYKILERWTTGRYSRLLSTLACSSNAMIEWAVEAEPADKMETLIKTIEFPDKTMEGACKYAEELNRNLGRYANPDRPRHRIFFEKDMVDIQSPLWFRLVLKKTNGEEVTREEVVKSWMIARGYNPPSDKYTIAPEALIKIAVKEDGKREDEWKGLCFVWIDDDGNVKEIYFNEDAMARLFHAGDVSTREFAGALVKNYAAIPSLKADVQIETQNHQIAIKTYTWIYKSPKGYQVKVFERACFDNAGNKIDLKMFENNPEWAMALMTLRLADKHPKKYFTIFAIKPEAAQAFD